MEVSCPKWPSRRFARTPTESEPNGQVGDKPTFRPGGSSVVVAERIGDYALGCSNTASPSLVSKGLTHLEHRLRPFDTPED